MNDLLGVFDSSHYANLAVNNQENFKKANPFPHIYLDNFLPENIADEVSNSIPSPYDDTFDWISRDRENEVKQKMQFDETKLPFSVRMILREFNSKQFLLFLAINKLMGLSFRIKLYGLSLMSRIFLSSQKEIKSLKKDKEQFDPVGIFG